MGKSKMKEYVGDVPAYLVFLITWLCGLLGVTFLGGHFLMLKTPPPATVAPCTEKVSIDASTIQKWFAWSRIALGASFSNSDIIWRGLGKCLSVIPNWLIFYGFSIILLMIIPAIIFPLSFVLALYGSFQECETFPDKYIYTIPPLYFTKLCTKEWDWDHMELSRYYLDTFTSWLPHMMFHAMEACVFMGGNFVVWNLSATINTFMIIYGLFIKPFFNISEIFQKMEEYSSSMSVIILCIVLYGAFKYLSVYVFIGFCIAAVFILSKALIAELLKKD
jgi:hypothetical protein